MAELNYQEAMHAALSQELARDARVFAIECRFENAAASAGWQQLAGKTGAARARTVSGAAAGAAGAAIGAALAGLRPVVRFDSPADVFAAAQYLLNVLPALRALLQARRQLPLVFIAPTGAGSPWGLLHTAPLEGLFHGADLVVLAPAGPREAYTALLAAVRDDRPVLLLEAAPGGLERQEVSENAEPMPIGTAEFVRVGRDITLLCWGRNLQAARETADRLEKAGIQSEILNLRSLQPLDARAILQSVAKTHRAAVLQDGPSGGGFGAVAVQRIQAEALDELDGPIEVLSRSDSGMRIGSVQNDFAAYCADRITRSVAGI